MPFCCVTAKPVEGRKTLKGGDRASEGWFESKGRERVFERSGPGKRPPCKGKEGKEGKAVEGQAEQSVSEAAEVFRLQAQVALLESQLDVEKKGREDVQGTLKSDRLAWESREKAWDKTKEVLERAQHQAQRSSGGGNGTAVAASGSGGESSESEFRVYLQAAAVEMHSALNTCRHVAITLGEKQDTIKDMQNTLDAYPLAALLDPAKRPRPERGEGSPRHGSGFAFGLQEKAPKRPRK